VPAAIFLAKPFTPADLLKAASRAMARAANRLSPTA
jgi:FixJ family two-component response regulator